MLDVLVRNVDVVSRLVKGGACWVIGVWAIWRCYDRLCDLNGMYAMVLCVLFGLTMTGLGAAIMSGNDEGEQGEMQ